MKKFFLILSLMASSAVFAATSQTQPSTIDVSKLTPAQIAQLNNQVTEMTKEPVNVSASVRKEAAAWGELGANMGRAMVGAAKEVGVAADEFSQTSLGKIVVFLAAYKIIGKDVLSVVFGSFVLIFGYSLAIWAFYTRRWSEVTYERVPVLFGLMHRNRVVECETSSDALLAKCVVGGGALILSSLVGLNIIF